MRSFQYDSPDSHKIRIFQLDLNEEAEPLSGKLLSYVDSSATSSVKGFFKSFAFDDLEITKKLDGGQGYDALSWVWGPDGIGEPLHLTTVSPKLGSNGEVQLSKEPQKDGYIRVRPALCAFLRHLRKIQHKRFIWMDKLWSIKLEGWWLSSRSDAICIEQNNNADKSAQLPNLCDIYSTAKSVLIWLGSGGNWSDNVLNELPSVAEALERCAETDVELWRSPSWGNFNLPFEDGQFWIGMRQLLTNPWWSRLWTLQEASVTSDEVVSDKSRRKQVRYVLCGQKTISWWVLEDFALAARRCRIEDWVISGSWLDAVDDKFAFDAIDEVRTCKGSYEGPLFGGRLNASLLATVRRKATHPNDMIYGQTALMDRPTRKMFNPSSELSVQSLFLEFGKHYIRQEIYECLLNHTATKETLPGLPSWCPNFASERETLSLGSRWTGSFIADENSTDTQYYRAGYRVEPFNHYQLPHERYLLMPLIAKTVSNMARGKSSYTNQFNSNHPWQLQLVPDTPFIRLSGMDTDVVTDIVECNAAAEAKDFLSFQNLCLTSEWHMKCLKLAMKVIARSRPELSHESIIDTFARTITANRTVIRQRTQKGTVFDEQELIYFIGRYKSFASFVQDTMDAGQVTGREYLSDNTLDYLHVLRAITRRRRFFATAGGRVGIGPSDTKPGDKLCVVFFCPTPYLLRKTPERFSMVGEVYVHGLMYGEATEMHRKGQLAETQWVVE